MGRFEVVHQSLHFITPVMVVAFVDTEDLAPFRNLDVLMGQQEFSYAWQEGEAMNTVSGGVHHHGARPVDEVTRCYLFVSRLQDIAQGTVLLIAYLSVNGKDGADAYVHINVRRTVQGVENKNVLSLGIL